MGGGKHSYIDPSRSAAGCVLLKFLWNSFAAPARPERAGQPSPCLGTVDLNAACRVGEAGPVQRSLRQPSLCLSNDDQPPSKYCAKAIGKLKSP
jgi:hypothetical protein